MSVFANRGTVPLKSHDSNDLTQLTDGSKSATKCRNVTHIATSDFDALVQYARNQQINICIPGPEAPLVSGIVDYFTTHAPEIKCFGPSKSAAQLEASKIFAKDFMTRHSIPTARYQSFDSFAEASKHLETINYRVVIKADGLAAGKGVIVPPTMDEAQSALKEVMVDMKHGRVVIEEFLEGDEISLLSLSDGKTILTLPPVQDHKRIGDGDTGPNTGGMGTYAPAPIASATLLDDIDQTVLRPTIAAMQKEGTPFIGCLFTGLMLTADGPRVLEYNVRFGDPETQSCLPLLETDLAELLLACCDGNLSSKTLTTSSSAACTVVLASEGYPGAYAKGKQIRVDASGCDSGLLVFHAGTALGEDGVLKTDGGRVMAVTAQGESVSQAVERAYQGISTIGFEGMYYRTDIGRRALRHDKSV